MITIRIGIMTKNDLKIQKNKNRNSFFFELESLNSIERDI